MATCSECEYYGIDQNNLTQGVCTVEPPRVHLVHITNLGADRYQPVYFDPFVLGKRYKCRHFAASVFKQASQ
jgi:hypothetical protein